MEMVKILSRKKLTTRESQVLWFLMGELNGNLLKQKLIKTIEFCDNTGMERKHVDLAIKGLIGKEMVCRQTTSLLGCYWYSFNEATFGRVYAVEKIKEDVKGLRLIEGGKSKKLSTNDENQSEDRPQVRDGMETDRPQVRDGGIPKLGTVSSSNFVQSLYRDKQKSQRQKELDAHEERKREYIPKGSNIFTEICERARKAAQQ